MVRTFADVDQGHARLESPVGLRGAARFFLDRISSAAA